MNQRIHKSGFILFLAGKVILLLLVFLFSKTLYSLDTTSIKYFPLRVGNLYVYDSAYYVSGVLTARSVRVAKILRDTLINNKRYFFCNNFPYPAVNDWYRTDTTTGSLMRYTGTWNCGPQYISEQMADTLAMPQGTFFAGPCHMVYGYFYNQCSIFPATIVGTSTQVKSIFGDNAHAYTDILRAYAFNIGLYRYQYKQNHGIPQRLEYLLKGCVLNGIVYGDTSRLVAGIEQISNEVPGNFMLFQNYPNPFNPSTTISFAIKNSSEVTLLIYDVGGKEISRPINNNYLNIGTYKFDFNGSGFSSGVYFYKLVTSEFSDVKKMVIIK